uniref:Spondin-1 n=1 Tax=Trichuris muris TaxID=70415 RepID=A0A5S6Q5X9_TRIMR
MVASAAATQRLTAEVFVSSNASAKFYLSSRVRQFLPAAKMRTAVAVVLLTLCFQCLAKRPDCDRRPSKSSNALKSPGNNGFQIMVKPYPWNGSADEVTGYIPGEKYTIVIQGWKTRFTVQTFRGFTLAALSSNDDNEPAGLFQLKEDGDIRWSVDCWHAVTHSSMIPKENVSVTWQAPPQEEGCVLFKAAVLEYPNIWYMDDDDLTKKLCPNAGYNSPRNSDTSEGCCSCDEAKYEIIFDGLWSRQTHPRDYPSLEHLTHFSDIIGASHSSRYVMWAYGGYASDGMKELAEWGNTQAFEQEIREQASEVRTIIKARGLWYPNVQGVTRAMFRVDKYHHLASLASMLGPSPDWVVGVSSFNLCLKNCSWIDEKTFYLYPFDAGVDGGITYMSQNNPSIPREPIRAITTKSPADPRSPFYNADSDTMPPFAKLTFRKDKVYPSECKDFSEYLLASRASGSETETSEDLENKNKKECTVLNWAPWSLCSATCGKGIRMRTRGYRNPIKAHIMGCSRQMNEKQFCNALLSVCHGSENFNDQCAASPWAQWTACSAKCGQGMRSRVRNYLNPMAIKQCSIPLTENENCTGAAGLDCNIAEDPLCQTTPWSDWSPCSRSCDEGIRLRTRILYRPENQDSCNHLEMVQKESCNLLSCATFMRTHAAEICSELMERGQCEGTFPRYYFDPGSKTCQRFTYTGCKGNRNNFLTIEHCKQTCLTEGDNAVDNQVNEGSDFNGLSDISKHADGLPKDCVVSGWSDWSDCSQTCGRGMKERVRTILSPAQNGGQPCPVELVEKARCRLRPCSVICRISSWSSWSACSASCGTGVQIRQRTAKNPHKQPECPAQQTEKRMCIESNC